jgi:phage shock protein C
MPITIIGYLAAVFLIPASPSRTHDDLSSEEIRKDRLREEILRAKPTVNEVRERYRSMDERLAKIEKYITSSRYKLDEEFRRL